MTAPLQDRFEALRARVVWQIAAALKMNAALAQGLPAGALMDPEDLPFLALPVDDVNKSIDELGRLWEDAGGSRAVLLHLLMIDVGAKLAQCGGDAPDDDAEARAEA